MKKNNEILAKILLTVTGCFIIGYIFAVSIRMNMVKQPEGRYIRVQDAMILAEAMGEEAEGANGMGGYDDWQELWKEDGESVLTYGQFTGWLDEMILDVEDGGGGGDGLPVSEEREGMREAIEELRGEYEEKYRADFRFLQEDWYRMYDALLAWFGMEETIRKTNVMILGCGSEVVDEAGNAMEEGRLLAEEGEYLYYSDVFTDSKYQGVMAYQKEKRC